MDALSFISGILFAAGGVLYIIAIVRGKKPQKVTWLVWSLLDSLTFFGMYSSGAPIGQILSAACVAWITFAFAIKYGTSEWFKTDIVCLGLGILGIVLWQTVDSATWAILAGVSGIIVGAYPTFVSAIQDPSQEDKLGWTLFWLSCIVAVAAVPKWTLDNAAQPLTFLAIESAMMYLLFIRPQSLARV